jgi:hypothetical protein
MGLAAGINFSLRSVALAAESYRRDEAEQLIKSDELLQMFGRAGRRGLDETGFVLITANELRLLDSHPAHLSRNGAVDWGALLGLMATAAQHGRDPYRQAVLAQERLFSTKPIILGVEDSLRHPDVPCGLKTDAERARHVRKLVRELLNSRGQWEPVRDMASRPLRDIVAPDPASRPPPGPSVTTAPAPGPEPADKNPPPPRLVPILSLPEALEKVGRGTLCVLSDDQHGKVHGRAMTVADRIVGNRVVLAKWVRRLTNWSNRQAPLALWHEKIAPLLSEKLAQQKTAVISFQDQPQRVVACVSLAGLTMRVPIDSHGIAIWRPLERDVLAADCVQCPLVPVCRELPTGTAVALLWRRLGLVDDTGVPTLRGRIVSFFAQGDGLAVAAALEDATYPLEELIYDLANLDAGFRFCGEDANRWSGRLAQVCHTRFGLQSIPGYLENGVPPKYGAGAEQVVAAVHKSPADKHRWVTDLLGPGDIDRIIIEWRSLLRQIAHAPELAWPRWRALQTLSRTILNETESPTLTDLPPLEYNQTRRVDHRLLLRRH